MKYKQGDRVRIRKDMKIDNVYGDLKLIEMMFALCGMTLTIKEITGEGFYRFVETRFTLSDAMIEGLADEPTRYKVGQKVNVRKDLKIGLRYDGVYFEHGMEDGCGTSQPIVSITENGHYEVELNGLIWVLSDAMLEPISDEPTRPEPSRLEIAAMAMMGILGSGTYKGTPNQLSFLCTEYADALIKECNRTKVEDRP